MKTGFAYVSGLLILCAGITGAETAQAGALQCRLDSAEPQLSAECLAERSALRVRITDCMTRRADEAQVAGAAAKSAHATRARYLLCAAEVRGTVEPVFP